MPNAAILLPPLVYTGLWLWLARLWLRSRSLTSEFEIPRLVTVLFWLVALTHVVWWTTHKFTLSGLAPLNIPQSFTLMGWVTAIGLAVTIGRGRHLTIVLVGLPLTVALTALAALLPSGAAFPPSQGGWLLLVHTLCFFGGLALLTLAAILGLLLLVQDRLLKTRVNSPLNRILPPLKELDDLVVRYLLVGFPIITAGLSLGLVLASERWKGFWENQVLVACALVGWLWFALLLQGRLVYGWRGRRLAMMTLVGLFLVVGTTYVLKRMAMQ